MRKEPQISCSQARPISAPKRAAPDGGDGGEADNRDGETDGEYVRDYERRRRKGYSDGAGVEKSGTRIEGEMNNRAEGLHGFLTCYVSSCSLLLLCLPVRAPRGEPSVSAEAPSSRTTVALISAFALCPCRPPSNQPQSTIAARSPVVHATSRRQLHWSTRVLNEDNDTRAGIWRRQLRGQRGWARHRGMPNFRRVRRQVWFRPAVRRRRGGAPLVGTVFPNPKGDAGDPAKWGEPWLRPLEGSTSGARCSSVTCAERWRA
jgi:hypothetical protein